MCRASLLPISTGDKVLLCAVERRGSWNRALESSSIFLCEGYVTLKILEFGTFDRRTTKQAAILRIAEIRQPIQRGIYQFWSGLQLRPIGDGRSSVPRTDLLTNVAAEYVAAHGFAQGLGNAALFLNGEVGDTEGRIHLAWGDQRVGGAGVDTAGAGSAAIRSDLGYL